MDIKKIKKMMSYFFRVMLETQTFFIKKFYLMWWAMFSELDRTRRLNLENRFFKTKELDFLLIPWTPKTVVGLHEPVRTVRPKPLAFFFL